MRRIYDISIPLVDGGVVWPGNPPIRVTGHQTIGGGTRSNVSALALGSHAGTHVDAQRHFFADGQTVDQIPLERMVGPALVVHIPDDVRSIGATELRKHQLEGWDRVLLRTRNSALLRRPAFVEDYTFLSRDGAEYLLTLGIQLVGIDYYSVEAFGSPDAATHRLLLGARVVIVEGLDLAEPPPGPYELVCLPLAIPGIDGAPARAILVGNGELGMGNRE